MKRLKILTLIVAVCSLESCVTNRKILKTLEGWKAKQDSLLQMSQTIFTHEKARIKEFYDNASDDDLLKQLNTIAEPKIKSKSN